MLNTETKRPPFETQKSNDPSTSSSQNSSDKIPDVSGGQQAFINVLASRLDISLSDEERERLRLENLSKHFPKSFKQPSLEDVYKGHGRLIPSGRVARRSLGFVYAARVGMAERQKRIDENTNTHPEFKKDVKDLTDAVDKFDDRFFDIYADEIIFINGCVPLLGQKRL